MPESSGRRAYPHRQKEARGGEEIRGPRRHRESERKAGEGQPADLFGILQGLVETEKSHGKEGVGRGHRHLVDLGPPLKDGNHVAESDREDSESVRRGTEIGNIPPSGLEEDPGTQKEPDRAEKEDGLGVLKKMAGHEVERPIEKDRGGDPEVEVEMAFVVADIVHSVGAVLFRIVRVAQLLQAGRDRDIQAQVAGPKALHQKIIVCGIALERFEERSVRRDLPGVE